MKQVLQCLKDGATQLAEVPAPSAVTGQLLIHTTTSLVSAGTERMLVEFGKANWVDKARQQPDKVRMVLERGEPGGWRLRWRRCRASWTSRWRPGIAILVVSPSWVSAWRASRSATGL